MNPNEGRRVKEIWSIGANGDEVVRPKDGEELVFRNDFHGDHDNEWICLYRGEVEICRYNANYASCIVWEEKR